MNPVFPAVMQALMKSSFSMWVGIPHVPKARKPIEEGGAFAKSEEDEK